MKNNYFLMLLASAFLLISCRTELDSTHQHEQENLQKSIHNKISINDFKKETHLQTISDFSQANNLLNKGATDSDFIKKFSIDETSIYKMDVNDKQTYSLRAYNIFESPDDIYNLVYRKKNNEIRFSIVKIVDSEIIPVYDSEKGILTKVSNPSASRICTNFYSVELWHCKEGVSWSQCDKCGNCLSYSSGYTSYECGGSAGDTNPGSPTTPSGPITPGGGTGDPAYDPSGYTFDPNIPTTYEVSYIRASRASSFFNQLDYGTQIWAGQHGDIYCAILENYLNQLPTLGAPQNTNAFNFANWSVRFLVQNPDISWDQFKSWFLNINGTSNLTFNNNVNSFNSIKFNNLSDLKTTLLNKNDNLTTESSILQDNGSEKVVSARVKRTGIWGSGEEVRVKLKKVNNVLTFDSVTSSELGVTLGVWTFTQIDYTQNTNSNVLTVEVTGYENYNIFLEGLGTVYKDKVMIRVKINTTTGNIFSIQFLDL
jgi:hypothetical protein